MSNYIIYGTVTQTVLGVDEAVVLDLPAGVQPGDDDFEDWLEENFYELPQQTPVPFEDLLESLQLILEGEGIDIQVQAGIIGALNDAVGGNVF